MSNMLVTDTTTKLKLIYSSLDRVNFSKINLQECEVPMVLFQNVSMGVVQNIFDTRSGFG